MQLRKSGRSGRTGSRRTRCTIPDVAGYASGAGVEAAVRVCAQCSHLVDIASDNKKRRSCGRDAGVHRTYPTANCHRLGDSFCAFALIVAMHSGSLSPVFVIFLFCVLSACSAFSVYYSQRSARSCRSIGALSLQRRCSLV
ncbi:hypothetical protein BD311DRAFT_755677 [Dichomitus squalens]|uniref:Uncharacterized protein n=1 Tax=Dichomitus squalens TaxID=114155 RepID=A0A4Q9MPY3_9APHY|nr:hypothetical protein BD311DRAFT_755677 [Dichomitus squalens]